MSAEVRTGLLALVAIALTLWGIKYIQGSNLLSNSQTFYAYYDNVAGVQVGTPVQVSGVAIGSVASVDLSTTDRRVKVTFNIEKPAPLPQDTRAILATISPLGDMAVIMDYDQPCQGTNCAEDGSELAGVTRGMIESLLGEGGLESYIQQLTDGMKSVIDTLNNSILSEDAEGPLAESVQDLRSTMSNLNQATARVNTLMQRSAPALESSLADVSRLMNTLEQQKDNIAGIIANADSLSQQLVDAQLDDAIEQVKGTLVELDATVATAKEAMAGVDGIVNKLEAGEGSLGKLLQDENLYNNLTTLSYNLDTLVADLQDRPYRYIPLKSRRKVERYDRQEE